MFDINYSVEGQLQRTWQEILIKLHIFYNNQIAFTRIFDHFRPNVNIFMESVHLDGASLCAKGMPGELEETGPGSLK